MGLFQSDTIFSHPFNTAKRTDTRSICLIDSSGKCFTSKRYTRLQCISHHINWKGNPSEIQWTYKVGKQQTRFDWVYSWEILFFFTSLKLDFSDRLNALIDSQAVITDGDSVKICNVDQLLVGTQSLLFSKLRVLCISVKKTRSCLHLEHIHVH